ncbi:MAG: diversity-generating retroelement protein Avd [Chloroflexi bacterium]|nr:diversity-generating retroelement protein Avd [Chloroflexota bacterium]
MKESPIFIRAFDLMMWLLPATTKFPKEQRFILAQRVQHAAFGFYEAITAASLSKRRQAQFLEDADIELQRLRLYLRLSRRLEFLDSGQYEHVFKMIEEIGRLLGGWSKKTEVR